MVVIAIFEAFSMGNPNAPVLMDGKAMVRTPFCSASFIEFR